MSNFTILYDKTGYKSLVWLAILFLYLCECDSHMFHGTCDSVLPENLHLEDDRWHLADDYSSAAVNLH